MANNIAREYIDFSKKNITKYLKIILDKYYAKKKYSWKQFMERQTDYDNTANRNKFLNPTDKDINISFFHVFIN